MALTIRTAFGPEDVAPRQELLRQIEKLTPSPAPQAPSFSQSATPILAYRGHLLVAHAQYQIQPGNDDVGTIGHFHALDDSQAVTELLRTAARFLTIAGAKRIIGPMDGDTWHPYRINTGPYDAPPFIREPWNPPYYADLWLSAGFRATETYDSFIIDNPDKAAHTLVRFHARALRNGHRFDPITPRNYLQLLPSIHALSCEIFADNVLYTPIDQSTFISMYAPAKTLLDKGLSWIAYDRDNRPAGYIFTYPDVADALRAMRGRHGISAAVRFLLHRRKATRTCIKTLGVRPTSRGSGLTAALMYLSFHNSALRGFNQTLMCLMHSRNDSRRFSGGADRPFRTYALYELPR